MSGSIHNMEMGLGTSLHCTHGALLEKSYSKALAML